MTTAFLLRRRAGNTNKSRSTRVTHPSRLGLVVLEGRDVPAFLAPVAYPVGTGITDVLTADFNGDGRDDVAALDSGGNAVRVLLANANGTLQSALAATTNAHASSLAAGDVNGDGHLDLVTGHGGFFGTWDEFHFVSVLAGNGDGTFQAPVRHNVAPSDGSSFAIAAGDVNGDGADDIVVACGEGDVFGQLHTLLSQGNGSFAHVLGADVGEMYNPYLRLADFNEDGHLDALAGDYTTVFVGNGDGTFAAGAFTGTSYPAVADFTNDGHQDVAMMAGSAVSVRPGTGAGQFGSPVTYPTGASGSLGGINPGDFNGDGLTDAVVGSGASAIAVLLANANHTLGPVFNLSTPFGAVGDFNGDGRDDLAAYDGSVGVIRLSLNDGNWTPPPPAMSVGDASVTEGNTGTRTINFTVTLSSASAQVVTVPYATANGTAVAGSDYQAKSGTLTFAPGESSKTVSVTVTGDRVGESNETFYLNLGNPTNAIIADSQGVGTVVDDEPRISINDEMRGEGRKNTTTQFVFTVTLSAAYDQAVTLSYRTLNGTATTGDKDYVAKTGTLTFSAGQTTTAIAIVVNGDNKAEADETFFVDVYGVGSNAVVLDALGLGTIWNDD